MLWSGLWIVGTIPMFVDGTAWFNPGCENHVIRGGAWSSAKEEFSSSNRSTAKSNFTDARVGFRIALTLKNK